MTAKQEIRERTQQMAEGAFQFLMDEIDRLLVCGALELCNQERAKHIPKVLLHVALQNIANEYRPLSQEAKADAANLQHF